MDQETTEEAEISLCSSSSSLPSNHHDDSTIINVPDALLASQPSIPSPTELDIQTFMPPPKLKTGRRVMTSRPEPRPVIPQTPTMAATSSYTLLSHFQNSSLLPPLLITIPKLVSMPQNSSASPSLAQPPLETPYTSMTLV